MADTSKVVIQEPDIKFEELGESARKLRKQLLQIPVNRAEKALKFMTPRVGLRVAETVGTLDGDMEFGPYDEDRVDTDDVKITPRTLLVYLGSVVKDFSPNKIAKSIWGPSVLHGEAMKNTDLAVRFLLCLPVSWVTISIKSCLQLFAMPMETRLMTSSMALIPLPSLR